MSNQSNQQKAAVEGDRGPVAPGAESPWRITYPEDNMTNSDAEPGPPVTPPSSWRVTYPRRPTFSYISHSSSPPPPLPVRQPPRAYPNWPPPPPQYLLSHRREYESSLDLQSRYRKPEGATEDQHIYCIYRIYEHLVLNHRFGLRNHIEYLFHRSQWPVASLPDPEDPDPARYAVLACIPALLVEAFNENIGRSIPRHTPSIVSYEEIEQFRREEKKWESVPEWTKRVPPLETTLVIPHDDGEVLWSLDDPTASPAFKEKNILLQHPHISFI